MVVIDYDEALGGWQTPTIGPRQPIPLDPAASVLHYAQEIFEGMKAYAHPEGGVIGEHRPETGIGNQLRADVIGRGRGVGKAGELHGMRVMLRASQGKISVGMTRTRRRIALVRSRSDRERTRASRRRSGAKRRKLAEDARPEGRAKYKSANEKGASSPSVETPFHGQRPEVPLTVPYSDRGLPSMLRRDLHRPRY
jgi:hypothetical protein